MRVLIEPHEHAPGEAPSRFEFFRPLEGPERLGSPFKITAKVGDLRLQAGPEGLASSDPGLRVSDVVCALLRHLRALKVPSALDEEATRHLEAALTCYADRPTLVEWPEGFRKGEPVYVPF